MFDIAKGAQSRFVKFRIIFGHMPSRVREVVVYNTARRLVTLLDSKRNGPIAFF